MKTKTPKKFPLNCYRQSKAIVEQVFYDYRDFISACNELLRIEKMEDFKRFYKTYDLNTLNKKIHFYWMAQGILFTRNNSTESLKNQVLSMEEMVVLGYGKAHVNDTLYKIRHNPKYCPECVCPNSPYCVYCGNKEGEEKYGRPRNKEEAKLIGELIDALENGVPEGYRGDNS